MKAFKLIGATAAAALVLLTSCLGDGGTVTSNTTFAVGGTSDKTYKTVLNTPGGAIYSPALAAKVVDGACYTVSFEIDSKNPENANAATNGYYTATVSALDEVAKGTPVYYNIPDTAKLLDKEVALTNAGVFNLAGIYVDGYLFLGAAFNGLKDQKNTWTLYWDRTQKPVVEEDVPTYSLFLRSAKSVDGTGSTATSINEIRAFEIEAVLKSVNNTELDKGSKQYNLKINYLNNINEKDSADLTWKSFSLPFAVVKES